LRWASPDRSIAALWHGTRGSAPRTVLRSICKWRFVCCHLATSGTEVSVAFRESKQDRTGRRNRAAELLIGRPAQLHRPLSTNPRWRRSGNLWADGATTMLRFPAVLTGELPCRHSGGTHFWQHGQRRRFCLWRRFRYPNGLAFDTAGNLCVDGLNSRVLLLAPLGPSVPNPSQHRMGPAPTSRVSPAAEQCDDHDSGRVRGWWRWPYVASRLTIACSFAGEWPRVFGQSDFGTIDIEYRFSPWFRPIRKQPERFETDATTTSL
jgi:hypothetical protein